ncbi:unnamed protein product [Adineta ricciae]|uniref:Uncharacterized protein n=1 Tax=Adineta ricciae TaxID=249248 RepID=A0A815DPP9_ADIRI|nr:unnamed protein product [Adineta ricciae]
MIRQHYLQQQRLNNNHDRLLQRFQGILTPHITEFRAFGRSVLPGRNYERHISSMNGNNRRRESLVAQSRASIGSSSETYRLMGEGINENLPRDIKSIMQHTREQPSPLVLAEKKFEPVAFYEHPVFGRTPSYVRPVSSRDEREKGTHVDDDESDTDDDTPLSTSRAITPKIDQSNGRRSTTPAASDDNDDDDDEHFDHIPLGYISYKKWKSKYANIIPVNPLLYNIYTHRSNGSLDSYGHSLYTPRNQTRALTRDEDSSTPTISDIGSTTSDTPYEPSTSTNRQYQRLQSQLFPRTTPVRPRESSPAESDDEDSDSDSNASASSALNLSKNNTSPVVSTRLPTSSLPITPSSSTTPSLPVPLPMNTSDNDATGISSTPVISPSTSNIPPPPLPPSFLSSSTNNTNQTPSRIPPAPSSVLSGSTNNTYQTTSTIPPAPPLPPNLLSSTNTNTYQRPFNNPPPAPLSTTSSAGIYQTTSNASLPPAPSKAVTFGGSSSFPVSNNDVSSSSDSDDDEKEKRRRRKKRQTSAGQPADSSSDD